MLIITYNNNKDPIMIHNVYVCTAGYVYMHVNMCRGQMRVPDALELVISCQCWCWELSPIFCKSNKYS